MSEEKKVRSVSDIHVEYSQLCSRAGHLQYQLHVLSKDLDIINDQLRALNLEAATLSSKEEAKPEEASVNA
jgi:hypothetical protein